MAARGGMNTPYLLLHGLRARYLPVWVRDVNPIEHSDCHCCRCRLRRDRLSMGSVDVGPSTSRRRTRRRDGQGTGRVHYGRKRTGGACVARRHGGLPLKKRRIQRACRMGSHHDLFTKIVQCGVEESLTGATAERQMQTRTATVCRIATTHVPTIQTTTVVICARMIQRRSRRASAGAADADGVGDGTLDCDDPCPNDPADGSVSVITTRTRHLDGDADGYGNPEVSTESPTQPSGYEEDGTDCSDNGPTYTGTINCLGTHIEGMVRSLGGNRIECHFTAMQEFALCNTDHRTHEDHQAAIQHYLAWSNRRRTFSTRVWKRHKHRHKRAA